MSDRETASGAVPEEPPNTPQAPGNLDDMPHLRRRTGDNALLDEAGNVIPPGHETGRSGSADITWESGKSQPELDSAEDH